VYAFSTGYRVQPLDVRNNDIKADVSSALTLHVSRPQSFDLSSFADRRPQAWHGQRRAINAKDAKDEGRKTKDAL
jgi:hypothetical protein